MEESIEVKKNKIKEQIAQLTYEFKVDLPKRISEARSYGDLKENAEYHAARERQAFLKARITQLSNQMSQLNNLNVSDIHKDRIGFGSTVTLEDIETGEHMDFTFVATNEVKPSEGRISLSSPFGIALQNKSTGEIVEVNIPAGRRKFLIKKFITIHGDSFEHMS